jgi:hypothetical protein
MVVVRKSKRVTRNESAENMGIDLYDLGVYIAKNGLLASSARVAQLVERMTSK